jgi:hypothetical protein
LARAVADSKLQIALLDRPTSRSLAEIAHARPRAHATVNKGEGRMPTVKKAPAHKVTHESTGTDASRAPAGGSSAAKRGTPASQRTDPNAMPVMATSGSTGYDYIGVLTVDAENCAMRFEERQYLLAGSASNYNTLFSMLLACWLEGHKVKFGYTSTTEPDAARYVVSLTTLPI